MKIRPSGLEKRTGVTASIETGAGLSRATILLRQLRLALETTFARSLTYAELSEYAGEPKSTLARWFNGEGQPSSETLLRLLELAPEKQRDQIMDKPPFCRVFAHLEHPLLAHDPVATSFLRSIRSNLTGTTLIQGVQESWLTFVATALGHDARRLSGLRPVLGLDVHKPDWFVPVPGIKYLNNLLRPSSISEELEQFWPKAANRKGAFVIFNGVLPTGSLWTDKVLDLAGQSHVVLTAKDAPKGQVATPFPVPANLITVTEDRNYPDRLRLDFRMV
jgi:transcriptional regulator with XRE-family HTH domain